MKCNIIFFFFSSRRRHTRLQGDWSSDVCSSDLWAASASFDPSLALLERGDCNRVEIGHAVGLRPKAHSACPGEGGVLRREKLPAVERDRESITIGPQLERVPFVGGNFGVGALELLPLSLDHA